MGPAVGQALAHRAVAKAGVVDGRTPHVGFRNDRHVMLRSAGVLIGNPLVRRER